jgi:hypothetical protein
LSIQRDEKTFRDIQGWERKKSITEKLQNEEKLAKDEIPPDSSLGILLTPRQRAGKTKQTVLHSVRFSLQMFCVGLGLKCGVMPK